MAEYHLPPIAQSNENVESLTPLNPSPEGWVTCVLADFDAFLQDHASAEKKASGMALSMVSHYPDQPALVQAMVDLAVEELNHYKEVMRLLMTRQISPAADRKDPYVTRLNKLVRKDAVFFLLDRLLVGAIVERRGAEPTMSLALIFKRFMQRSPKVKSGTGICSFNSPGICAAICPWTLASANSQCSKTPWLKNYRSGRPFTD